MSDIVRQLHRTTNAGVIVYAAAVAALFGVFWTTVELQSAGFAVPGVRAVVALFLLLFVPGALLARLLAIPTDRFGTFVVFAVGFSVAVTIAMTVVASVVLPVLGIERPLSLLPLTVFLTVVLAGLLLASHVTGTTLSVRPIRLSGPPAVILFLLSLPTITAAGVLGMEQFGTNLGMFVVVGAILGVVLLASTKYLPRALYPFTVFSVSLSTLLHRNLLTDHVIGDDIQASYFLSQLILETGQWTIEGSSMSVLAVVTSVPASFATFTGLELATTFKLVHVFAFALVPVGLFYAGRQLFDDHVALFGSFAFIFYHGTFYFTPGKQLMAELFVVLALLVFVLGLNGARKRVALLVLAVALVFSHYGVTYIFGGSLFVAYVGLALARRFLEDFEHELSVWHPVGLLALATGVYASTTPGLLSTIGSVPLLVVDLVDTFVRTGSIPGSGASYAQTGTTVFDSVNVLLYVLLTGLIGVGLSRDVLVQFDRVRKGIEPERIEYVALAVPLFGLLCLSYFVTALLQADRVYQMVLTVLAPYAAFGFVTLLWGLQALRARVRFPRFAVGGNGPHGTPWALLAILLCALLAFNSGMAYAFVGSAELSTFDARANDQAYSNAELDAANWLEGNVATIERYDRFQPPPEEADESTDQVTIHTETRGFQLFRSVTLPGYTNVELVRVKSKWQPEIYDEEFEEEGYVFVRQRSVADIETTEEPSPTHFSREEVDGMVVPRNVIYSSDDAQIAGSTNASYE